MVGGAPAPEECPVLARTGRALSWLHWGKQSLLYAAELVGYPAFTLHSLDPSGKSGGGGELTGDVELLAGAGPGKETGVAPGL